MQKLSARERRHKAVLNKIARLTRARNEGIKAIVAAETQLPALERQARRNELPVKPRKPKPVTPPPAPEPKAKRRPKAETPTPQAGLDISLTPEERDAHMVAFGFRKSKRKPAPADVV